MIQRDIIRPSTSAYAAPLCPVRKKGTLRLCVDYRALNSKTNYTAIATGNLLEAVESMEAALYFSTIDLAQGYFQVPITENDNWTVRPT